MERIWLGLRTSSGLALCGLPEVAREMGRGWVEAGLARDGEEALRLTPAGWLLLDELTVELERCVSGP